VAPRRRAGKLGGENPAARGGGEARLIYANNHYEGFSPATCERIARLIGVEVALPELPAHTAARPSAQLELGF
jgi:hypothetical protein